MKTLRLLLVLAAFASCDQGSNVTRQSAKEDSSEYQAHLEKRRVLYESLGAVIMAHEAQVAQELREPSDQLNELFQDLSTRSAFPAIREKIEEIIAFQRNESASREEILERCYQGINELEVLSPGFSLKIEEKFTIFSCITSKPERSVSRVRQALECHVRESNDQCFSQLSETERRSAERVLMSAEVNHASR